MERTADLIPNKTAIICGDEEKTWASMKMSLQSLQQL